MELSNSITSQSKEDFAPLTSISAAPCYTTPVRTLSSISKSIERIRVSDVGRRGMPLHTGLPYTPPFPATGISGTTIRSNKKEARETSSPSYNLNLYGCEIPFAIPVPASAVFSHCLRNLKTEGTHPVARCPGRVGRSVQHGSLWFPRLPW